MFDVKSMSAQLGDRLIEYRRHFHMNPELSFKEVETATFIRRKLTEAGIELLPGVRGNSVVGQIDSGKPGKTIAFRADFDALNMTEKNTDKPYCSRNENVMHACGHDIHTAVLLCIAETMASYGECLTGKVRFLFQQGEERQPGGAVMLVEDGMLEGVDYVLGLHVQPEYPAGTVVALSGPVSAAVDDFQLFIHGKGSHGARPHLSNDPIMCGVSIVNELQQIVSRVCNPQKPLVITVGKFCGGHARNIIPDDVELMATIRNYDVDVREMAEERIREVIDHVCKMHHCTYDLIYEKGYPALINPVGGPELLKEVAESLGYAFATGRSSMGSEDFSYYLHETDGLYFHIGSGDGTERFLHNPHYDMDEKCMTVGFECMLGMYNKLIEN